jgi:hypothetical protein
MATPLWSRDFPIFWWDIDSHTPSLKMQPHTPVALGFTTGLEVLCGGAAHAQPGAQTPASAAAAYNTPLTTLRGAGRMPDREDGTSGWWHICTTHFFSSLFLGGYCFV